jgi:hypothetical protein
MYHQINKSKLIVKKIFFSDVQLFRMSLGGVNVVKNRTNIAPV